MTHADEARPEYPRFLLPLPEDLQARADDAVIEGGARLEQHAWDEAYETFSGVVHEMVDRQPEGRRFHKGMPYHNMGLARLLARRPDDAVRLTLYAFAEDALSLGDERGPIDEELRRPAAENLRSIFLVDDRELRGLGQRLRAFGAEQPWPDPRAALDAAGVQLRRATAPTPTPTPAPRGVGQFTTRWEDRVFIGGPFRLIANLAEIKRICEANGFDGVLASDFAIPADLAHHHALLLLHECRLAIFELSMEAGQLMELERTRDYEINAEDVLVLVQAAAGHTARLSGMVEGLLGRLGIPTVSYSSLPDLPGIIEPWLDGRRV